MSVVVGSKVVGAWEAFLRERTANPSVVGLGGRVPGVAECDGGEKIASWTDLVTGSGGGDDVLVIKGSNSASSTVDSCYGRGSAFFFGGCSR